MFHKSSKTFNPFSLSSRVKAHFSTKKGGNLYTWGTNLDSLGYYAEKHKDPISTPQKVDRFDNNVAKVSLGPNHSAVITTTGELYTFGKNKYSALGNTSVKHRQRRPELVKFFKDQNLKVVDVVCGEKFTLALTDDGDVWSWGNSRRSSENPFANMFVSLFPSSSNELGQGSIFTKHSPSPILPLRNYPPFKSLAAGLKFGFALNVKKNLYYWGKGEYGVFGDGHTRGLKSPKFHEHFQQLQKKNGMKIKKIKAAGNYAMAVFNNGTLWAWGDNIAGQLGLEDEFHENFENIIKTPAQVTTPELEGQRIIDFDLGETISILLTNEKHVYWSGSNFSSKPVIFELPSSVKVKKIGAAGNSIAVLSEDNLIYMKNSFMEKKFEDPYTGVEIADFTKYSKGKIMDIGGTYGNRFAIVHE